jgi:hypothetical protein
MSDTSGYPMPAMDSTHHVDTGGKPAYAKRFKHVGKFHPPGLAPVCDDSGWYHIRPDGQPAYSQRYEKVWGFYCLRAAAMTQGRWTHIAPDGTIAYPANYSWVGNFQEGACAVQIGNNYMHIDCKGEPLYEERYAYVGDYRDGVAVAWVGDTRMCRHILKNGRKLHDQEYRYLGVFHKGLAKAKDDGGWTHVRMSGDPAYPRRYKSVEDFYNGLALVETCAGIFIRIDEEGLPQAALMPANANTGIKILITGNIGAGKTTLCKALSKASGWRAFGIDDARRIASDGSPHGEALAWAKFLEHAQAPDDMILEYTGCGPNSHLVSESLRRSGSRVLKVALDLSVADCAKRIAQRTWDIPYPFAKLPDEPLLQQIHHDLAGEWRKRSHLQLRGETSPDTNAQTILENIRLGLH